MSRITKEIATAVAEQLLSDKQTEIDNLASLRRGKVTKLYINFLPKEVFECHKNHPSYFTRANYVRLEGPGLGYETYSMDEMYPKYLSGIKITEKDANEVVKLSETIEKLEINYRRLKKEIEVALYNLRTYQNVEKQFPEAFKLLPAAKTALMINISSLREEIAQTA